MRALLAALAFLPAPQEAVTLARVYKAGEKDVYVLSMTLRGSVEFDMTALLTQTVKKLHQNGDADVENRMDDFKMTVMGDPVKSAPKPKPVVVRTTAEGVPADNRGQGGVMGLDLLRYVMVSPARAMKVGEAVPVATAEGSPVTGDVRLDKMEAGVATLAYDLRVASKEGVAPAKLRAVRTVETETGKTLRASGEVTDLPQADGPGRVDALLFTFERRVGK